VSGLDPKPIEEKTDRLKHFKMENGCYAIAGEWQRKPEAWKGEPIFSWGANDQRKTPAKAAIAGPYRREITGSCLSRGSFRGTNIIEEQL